MVIQGGWARESVRGKAGLSREHREQWKSREKLLWLSGDYRRVGEGEGRLRTGKMQCLPKGCYKLRQMESGGLFFAGMERGKMALESCRNKGLKKGKRLRGGEGGVPPDQRGPGHGVRLSGRTKLGAGLLGGQTAAPAAGHRPLYVS